MARETESADVDSAYTTLQTNALAWLAAGGTPELLGKVLISRLSVVSPRMATAFHRLGVDKIKLNRVRGKTLATADTAG